MLCHCCDKLDLDQIRSKNGYLHHVSREALQHSAYGGCDGCAAICSQQFVNPSSREEVPLPENISELPYKQIICTTLGPHKKEHWGFRFWQPNLVKKLEGLFSNVSCFVEPGDLLSGLFNGRPVAETSNSEEAFGTAARWFRYCVENHTKCGPASAPVPTRLVHVGSFDTEPHIALPAGENIQWATLSHCWGSSRSGITTASNIEDRKKKLEVANLPILYRDAIEIIRKLGLDYIWIDSLCIIQDSKADWNSESAKMDQYYTGAYLNISPSGASDSNMGIFATANLQRARFRSLVAFPCISNTLNLTGILHFREYKCATSEGIEKPLLSRAWVLQEHIFSSRILWYDTNELRWQCHEMTEVESFHRSEAYGHHSSHLGKGLFVMPTIRPWSEMDDIVKAKSIPQVEDAELSGLLRWWYSTLYAYTKRKMTYPDDRLPGIAGLAKEFSKRTGYNYICGLWREDIIRGLCWSSSGPRLQTALVSSPPTWSWASTMTTDGSDEVDQLQFSMSGLKALTHVPGHDAEVVDINVVNEGANIYARVESASLTLRGRWKYMNQRDFSHKISTLHWNLHSVRKTLITGILDAPPDTNASNQMDLGQNVIYFQLRKWLHSYHYNGMSRQDTCCLILKPVDVSENVYRRIGLAEIPEVGGAADGWPTKTVVII